MLWVYVDMSFSDRVGSELDSLASRKLPRPQTQQLLNPSE